MRGEGPLPGEPGSGFISDREHFERILSEKDTALAAALAAANKALDTLALTAKENKESANEWREAMKDREANFLTRREFFQIVATIAVVVTLVLAITSYGG